tara:strand:- start:1130 stop:1372 length:243 start_codon:yes stop_codon:yes gene_type:complete
MHFIELKTTKANAVKLSPHQIAFMTKHKKSSVWVLVRQINSKELFLYHGSQVISLAHLGLKSPPTVKSDDFNLILKKISN